MNYKLPDVHADDFNLNSEKEKIIIYRKFFAEMRLDRLHYHKSLLKLFLGTNNQEEIRSLMQSNIIFLNKILIWINRLKENGNYDVFKKACTEEMDAIEKIIQTYESRMSK